MQTLAETEYQNIYRITDGVLLVVNKFVRTDYPHTLYNPKTNKYNKNCQDGLRVLKEDYYDKHKEIIIKKGTVLYNNRPVVSTTDELSWQYQIKTTGDSFSGNVDLMDKLLSDILYRIRCGKCR